MGRGAACSQPGGAADRRVVSLGETIRRRPDRGHLVDVLIVLPPSHKGTVAPSLVPLGRRRAGGGVALAPPGRGGGG